MVKKPEVFKKHYTSLSKFYREYEEKTEDYRHSLHDHNRSLDWEWIGDRRDTVLDSKWGSKKYIEAAKALVKPEIFKPMSRSINIFSDDGDDMDMEKYMEGEEYSFIKRKSIGGNNRKKIHRIVVSAAEYANVDAENIAFKTMAVIKLIDHIESKGDRCEMDIDLFVENSLSNSTNDLSLSITVKRCEDPLNISLIAWTLSPEFFRYYLIGGMHIISDECNDRISFGHGQPKTPEAKTGEIVVPSNTVLSKEAAEEFLTKHI